MSEQVQNFNPMMILIWILQLIILAMDYSITEKNQSTSLGNRKITNVNVNAHRERILDCYVKLYFF